MAYTKLLTIREVYASIPITQIWVIEEMFENGLELNNDRLAISAAEELIQREDFDEIVEILDGAFGDGQIDRDGTLVTMLARVLKDECRENDPILAHYGTALFKGEFMGPTEWLRKNGTRYNDGAHTKTIEKAKPWATKELNKKHDFSEVLDDLRLEQSELH